MSNKLEAISIILIIITIYLFINNIQPHLYGLLFILAILRICINRLSNEKARLNYIIDISVVLVIGIIIVKGLY
ncbi:hypothetical protein CLOTH_20500 [Alkalithermobacter paradoxus]|uniref:Uncharacterized protein n=1 Tax=Alkalithermobacter paradoxus TaxID=29349 RepID=A0A1V4I442_9FIRM|nr:hypothetical protein CLOTH_20500 [[Clostridium] thermoalcaliphilum]